MANIKKRQQVESNADLQNVITSAIIRQSGEFTREDVYRKVEDDIKFSAFGKYGRRRKSVDVNQMVDSTIDILLANSFIRNIKNGRIARICI